jgi:tetratricopeptide (TPR) repeat protein
VAQAGFEGPPLSPGALFEPARSSRRLVPVLGEPTEPAGTSTAGEPLPAEEAPHDLWQGLRGSAPTPAVEAPAVAGPAADAPPPAIEGEAPSGETHDAVPGEGELVVEEPLEIEQEELPWARIRPRTAEMAAVLEQAELLTRRGVDLASRGATFTARGHFVQALRTISQALDAQQETDHYSRALAQGLTALKEAQDFVPRAGQGEVLVDVAAVAAGHRTELLRTGPPVKSALAAVQRYYTYAQEQLASAAGCETAGSHALYQLGKLTAATAAGAETALVLRGQAMVLHQAALLSDERNFRAAHELGVLLAQSGRWEQARQCLTMAAAIGQQPASWHNLAIVHERLGDAAAAAQARARLKGRAGTRLSAAPQVHWVDPGTLARIQSATDGLTQPRAAATARATRDGAAGRQQ